MASLAGWTAEGRWRMSVPALLRGVIAGMRCAGVRFRWKGNVLLGAMSLELDG